MKFKNIKVVREGFLLRVLLSPIVFLYATFIVASTIFLIMPLTIIFSLISLITYPFILLLRKVGMSVEVPKSHIIDTKYPMVEYLLGLTYPVWFSPYATYKFILGEDVFGEKGILNLG